MARLCRLPPWQIDRHQLIHRRSLLRLPCKQPVATVRTHKETPSRFLLGKIVGHGIVGVSDGLDQEYRHDFEAAQLGMHRSANRSRAPFACR